jgi:hypothetical protein
MCHCGKYIKGTYSAEEALKGREKNYVCKRLSENETYNGKKN